MRSILEELFYGNVCPNTTKKLDRTVKLFLIQINTPITMIHLMLNDLCRPAGEVFRARLHLGGLILNLDSLIALTLARLAAQPRSQSLNSLKEAHRATADFR